MLEFRNTGIIYMDSIIRSSKSVTDILKSSKPSKLRRLSKSPKKGKSRRRSKRQEGKAKKIRMGLKARESARKKGLVDGINPNVKKKGQKKTPSKRRAQKTERKRILSKQNAEAKQADKSKRQARHGYRRQPQEPKLR